MSRRGLFEGLVVDTNGQPVAASEVGGEAQYVVSDGGFSFHVPAEPVDREVLGQLRAQILANQEAVTQGTMKMLGQDDLFTKAMIDSSLKNMDEHFTRLIEHGLPAEARAYLGMLGFRIVLNYHGEVVSIDQPGIAGPEED
ncbi:MAG: hypothetical protein IT318_06650 [Anaerolineales bacterium]|nr:hypothetical protein [Anaerolineales bacterium]